MGNSSSPYSTLILIALMVVAFYFLIIRPNKKRQQAQLQTMNSLTVGTRVLLTSGFFGTLVEVGEKQAVLEISPGVHLTVLKQAIARPVRDGDEDSANEDDEAFGAYDPDSVHHEPLRQDSLDRVDDRASEVDDLHRGTGDGVDHTGGSHASDRDAELRRPGNDSDPRSGTNTTPIKD